MDVKLLAFGVPLLLALASLVWWLLARRRVRAPARASIDRLDTVADWPPSVTRVLTTPERLAHNILVRALPDHMILAQVPLARFLRVPTRNSYNEWLRRLGSLCADLVVCDHASQVLGVVEVQMPADQTSERARKRLNRMARVLKAADVPLHVWTENALPSVEAAREMILPRPAVPEPATPVAPAVPARVERLATDGPNPLDDLERDSTLDEVIEAREPPPSTWFDDFNSGPTPLGKTPKP
jgi:Protein of unknown function (DUF2726)